MSSTDTRSTGNGSTGATSSTDTGQLCDNISDAVRAHPAVLRMDGGPFGEITSYLPGRRVTGVRVAEDESVEVCVVALLDRPLPGIAAELRDEVRELAGPVPVHVTIADVEQADDRTPDRSDVRENA